MSTLKKLLSPVKEMKGRYFLLILSSIYFGSLRPISALIVSKVIKWFETKDIEYFKLYLIVFLGITIFNYGTNYFIRTFRRVTPRIFVEKLYKKYMQKYLKADNNQIEILWTGQANSIISSGCENRKTLVMVDLSGNLLRVIVGMVISMILFVTNLWPTISLIAAWIFIIVIVVSIIWNKRFKEVRENKRDIGIKMNRSIVRIIMSKFEVLQNNKITKEIHIIKDFIKKIIFRDKKESKWYIIASDLPRFIIDIIKVWILARYGIQIIEGKAWYAEFTLIWMLLNQIWSSLFDINEFMLNYHGLIVHVEKLRKTFDDIPPIKWYETGNTFKFKQWNIEIQKMSFSYWEKNIFENFSLKLWWEQKIALVGESWSGKTTLIKLISWYIHPTKGKILIDNQNLQETSLKSYYNNIGYLTQDPNVFDGTVIENLLYWTRKKPNKKEIQTAIKLSKCDFIYQFKDWLETQIWEKGVRLSGGQKQRLAIAKLFLKNPHIIFLDEPTSALDSMSEEQITQAFNNLFKNRTVIVAAHRLQTVKSADIIYVFDKWKIVEQGTHNQLLKKKWKYYKMIELQSGF
jgi:ATP-binding cassette, subfamily B, bacterial